MFKVTFTVKNLNKLLHKKYPCKLLPPRDWWLKPKRFSSPLFFKVKSYYFPPVLWSFSPFQLGVLFLQPFIIVYFGMPLFSWVMHYFLQCLLYWRTFIVDFVFANFCTVLLSFNFYFYVNQGPHMVVKVKKSGGAYSVAACGQGTRLHPLSP